MKLIAAAMIWLTILGLGSLGYKLIVAPAQEQKKNAVIQAEKDQKAAAEKAVAERKAALDAARKAEEDLINKTEPITFSRGSDQINDVAAKTLDEVMDKMKKNPQFTLIVKSNIAKAGDAEANKALATSRAESVVKYFIERGIKPERVKMVLGPVLIAANVEFSVSSEGNK